ncbi:MAG: hypothetical protein IT443_08725 [Phycisphaeraceae bacterium]|nr:hypothetical protein [Phycisphaeraceae bacterium]
MDRIELPCPSCGKTLKLDAAFSGSVCRCKYCGALLSVGDKEGDDGAVRLDRADKPTAPAGASPKDKARSKALHSGDSLPFGSPVIAPQPTNAGIKGAIREVGGSSPVISSSRSGAAKTSKSSSLSHTSHSTSHGHHHHSEPSKPSNPWTGVAIGLGLALGLLALAVVVAILAAS